MGTEGSKAKERRKIEKHRIINYGTAYADHARNERTDKTNKENYDDKIERHFQRYIAPLLLL